MFGHMKRYEEERRIREKQNIETALTVGAAIGLVAGFCINKYLCPKIQPKIAAFELGELVEKEKETLKEKVSAVKETIKDKLSKDGCCCCCDDDDCECTPEACEACDCDPCECKDESSGSCCCCSEEETSDETVEETSKEISEEEKPVEA